MVPEILLVAVGIALRLRQFLSARSLWLDEAWLGNAIVARPVSDLALRPLPDNQAAPPGFLALLKASIVVLGPTERALRLLPFLAGVVAVVMAWRVGERLFAGRAARCCLIGLVALSSTLVYYSNEAKQYGVDAAASLVLLYVALRTDGGGRGVLAVTGAVAPWLSHASIFLLPGTGLVRAVDALRRDGRRAFVPFAGVAIVWTASVAGLALLTRSALGNPILLQFWRAGYAPFPIRSASDVSWYAALYGDLVAMALKTLGANGPAPDVWWPAWLDRVFPALLLAGLVALARRPVGRRAVVIVLLAATAALAASIAQVYPLAHRLLVFAVPLLFVVVAGAVDGVAMLGAPGALVGAALAAGLVGLTVRPAIAVATSSPEHSDVKSALAYIAARAKPADQLAPTAWSQPAVHFYRPRFALDRLTDAPPVPPGLDGPGYVKVLRGSGMLRRTWIVVSHRFDERERFLSSARALTPQLDRWEGEGAGVYLFDFGAIAP